MTQGIVVIQESRRELCDSCEHCKVIHDAGTVINGSPLEQDACYCMKMPERFRMSCVWAKSLQDANARCPDSSNPERQARWALAKLDESGKGCGHQLTQAGMSRRIEPSELGNPRGSKATFKVYG